MLTKEQIKEAVDLTLLDELLTTYGMIIGIWRRVPENEQPTRAMKRRIVKLEIYAMRLVEELDKRGILPKSWSAK